MGGSGISVSTDRGAAREPGRLALLRATRYASQHWLFAANLALLGYATLPFAAPVLTNLGAHSISTAIFNAYAMVCHQKPSRSRLVLGKQVAYCDRCAATHVSSALAGLAYVRLRDRSIRPLPWRWYLALSLPIAIDKFTQLVGWRESTRFLRELTGTIFGIGTIWLAFPTVQASCDHLAREIDLELEGAA